MKFLLLFIGVLFVTLFFGVLGVNNEIKANNGELNHESVQFRDGKFHNLTPTEQPKLAKTLSILMRYITEKRVDTEPKFELPVQKLTRSRLEALDLNHVHVIKLGHSSILLKVYGEYWLIDPVFAERASPFSFLGPKRFHPTPLTISELPNIDKVFISHNHYDHLDKAAIKQLVAKTTQFLVPLGVETDLQKWGVNPENIISFDWWQERTTKHGLIAFTPTQHFSGRGLTDGNNTLWGSWVLNIKQARLYFSGDSGYFDGFKQIGQQYGPFDLTMIETGAYDKDWADIHMTPEESMQAHLDLQGRVMMPIHNGTFDLAFHPWYEPLERITQAAQKQAVTILTPIVGEIIQVGDSINPNTDKPLFEGELALPESQLIHSNSWWLSQ